jgi:ATP-binding cassette, subfamily B, bacterial
MDMTGVVVFGAVAVTVMLGIDPLVTVAIALPLAAMAVASRVLTARVRAYRLAGREATAAVTGFLGDLFGGILTVKSAGAEAATLAHLGRLAGRRRHTGLRDRLLADMTESFNTSTVDLSVGLVLLLAAPALRSGRLSVGDLTLFVSYTGYLVWLPYIGGRLLTRGRQAGVGVERMAELVGGGAPAALAVHRPLGLGADPPPGRAVPAPARPRPLERLEVRGLRAVHPSGRGLHGVDLELAGGTLTVVTGPVGSGKTTLVRALLGLVPADGLLLWNGRAVDDPAAFLVPPRCAYVPQVPRLLSASLADNVLLGVATGQADLRGAVELAALDRDVAAMPDGTATLVGARGTRLSGGQVQRVAVARALAGDPELLVLDDVSSALDVATERLLWQRLLSGGRRTLLAVSNRPATLALADRVVRLDQGRVTG